MKLREFGYIIYCLARSNMDSEGVGLIVDKLFPLVDDWSVDNDVSESNNAEWIQESYNDWVGSKTKEASG